VFDLKGSLLKNLKQIAGTNPIVIAANKVDLLPKDVSPIRLTSWIHAEAKEFCDLRSPKEVEEVKRQEMILHGWHRADKVDEEGLLRRSNVHLVSCQSGVGMTDLMGSLMGLAIDNGNKVYVMGAANVGKSSFINRLLESDYKKGVSEQRNGGRNKKDQTPQATVSNLPGTTLNFLKIKLPNGVTMIDTPGLINRGQLTSRLTTEELRMVCSGSVLFFSIYL
jgi:ribosome biogenesis GTPase A